MKRKNVAMVLLALVLGVGAALHGASEKEQGYIGIRMDTRPLPELFIKHMELDEDQGIRIQNVGVGTPGDKAGLEQDDIIIGLNGKDVTDSEEFAKAVQEAGVGAGITLEVIHLGKRKQVTLKLTSLEEASDFKAKFPPEPQEVESWQPGRMFRLQPDSQSWIQVGPGGGFETAFGQGGLYDTLETHINKVFKELYKYRYSTDEEDYTVTIEGNPADDDAKVIVKIEKEEHTTTVGKIDELPEKYRRAAEQAVKKARRTARTRQYRVDINRPVLPRIPEWQRWQQFYQGPYQEYQFQLPRTGPRGDMYERIEEQMREMQKRIDELEKRQRKGGDHGADENTEGESDEHGTDDSAEMTDQEKI